MSTLAPILVVDDVAANIVAIEAALEPLSAVLVPAHSGEQALARCLEQDFALVLLDVHMPDMDGFETARWIRSRKRSSHLPIIFVTAHDHDDAAVLRGYELGIVDFLFKPLNPDILRAKTSVFIELAKAQARDRETALREQRAQLENDALRHANEQLAETDRRKTEFLAMLGHELRNPLAPIRTSVDLLREGAPATRVVDIIDRNLRHVCRLVDDLLDVSRIGAGKLELSKEAVAVADVVDEVITIARPLVEARKQCLTVTGDDGALAVHGDRTRLVQLLTNLLTNAARYTPASGTIDVAWGRHDADAFVRVTDNGVGIAPEMIARVFDMFVQERVTSSGTGGLGLGLALAHQLAKLHDGTLTVASAGRGKGSTFELRLPTIPTVPPRTRTTRRDFAPVKTIAPRS